MNNPIGNELGNILDKLIEFGTKRRYQSASEVLQAMNLQARVTPTVIQPPVTPISPFRTPVTPVSPSPVMAVPTPSPSPILQNARGIDYRQLEDLLKRQQWKEADKETTRVMLQVANRSLSGWLREKDIDNFPCEDLRTIDRLWVHYSNGRFGFSVQAKIYRSLGGMREYNGKIWNAFGERVGWRVNNSWICYRNVTFDLKASKGHLPAFPMRNGFGWWRVWFGGLGFSSLASRLVKCNL